MQASGKYCKYRKQMPTITYHRENYDLVEVERNDQVIAAFRDQYPGEFDSDTDAELFALLYQARHEWMKAYAQLRRDSSDEE